MRQAAVGEGAVTALVRTAPRVLCYATQRGGLHGWDLRAPAEAYRIRCGHVNTARHVFHCVTPSVVCRVPSFIA